MTTTCTAIERTTRAVGPNVACLAALRRRRWGRPTLHLSVQRWVLRRRPSPSSGAPPPPLTLRAPPARPHRMRDTSHHPAGCFLPQTAHKLANTVNTSCALAISAFSWSVDWPAGRLVVSVGWTAVGWSVGRLVGRSAGLGSLAGPLVGRSAGRRVGWSAGRLAWWQRRRWQRRRWRRRIGSLRRLVAPVSSSRYLVVI